MTTAMPPTLTWSRWCLTHSAYCTFPTIERNWTRKQSTFAPASRNGLRNAPTSSILCCYFYHFRFCLIFSGEEWEIIWIGLRASSVLWSTSCQGLANLVCQSGLHSLLFKTFFNITTICKYIQHALSLLCKQYQISCLSLFNREGALGIYISLLEQNIMKLPLRFE